MTTLVGTIDSLIKILEDAKKEGYKYFVGGTDFGGQQFAPSKRRKFFKVGFAISEKAFNKKDLGILFERAKIAVFLFKDDSVLSEEAKKLIEEEEKAREEEGER